MSSDKTFPDDSGFALVGDFQRHFQNLFLGVIWQKWSDGGVVTRYDTPPKPARPYLTFFFILELCIKKKGHTTPHLLYIKKRPRPLSSVSLSLFSGLWHPCLPELCRSVSLVTWTFYQVTRPSSDDLWNELIESQYRTYWAGLKC